MGEGASLPGTVLDELGAGEESPHGVAGGDEGQIEKDDEPSPSGGALVTTAVVRFRVPGQVKEFATGRLELNIGARVVVESERGTRMGTVIGHRLRAAGREPASRVVRLLAKEDLEVLSRNKVREREAFEFCCERTKALSLPMKLVSVEFAHSGSSAIFHFTSVDRVDFRALVKDLARRFHTRIEMRQIGVRDASRFTGGIGVCGRELCCATWLRDFSPISVRMAKDQNLALNHEKLSGVCGRLKCCLAYEQPIYEEQRKGLPKVGKRVLTPAGEARVKDVNVLKRLVRVQCADGHYEEFRGEDVKRPVDLAVPAEQSRQDNRPARSESTAPREPRGRSPERRPEERRVDEKPADEPRERAPRAAVGPNPVPATLAASVSSPPAESAEKRRRRRRRRGRRGRGGQAGPAGQGGAGSGGQSGPAGGAVS
jgi:cell fate regulator YaaT (PSP1 superfamily)